MSPLTIASWTGRLEEEGSEALLRLPVPVSKFPEFVGYLVRRLKTLCPSPGKVKIAPGSRPSRSPSRADHGAEDAAEAAATKTSFRSPDGVPGRDRSPPEPCLACGLDTSSHRPRVLDPLASLRQAPGLAFLLVGRSGS